MIRSSAGRWDLRSAGNTDIPKIKPHEVLVWRVGGRYVVDRRELRANDDTVVRASSVSIVSVRPGTEVEVSFRIDSQDSAEFTVKVIFICSVTDPVIVVRDGQVNAADALSPTCGAIRTFLSWASNTRSRRSTGSAPRCPFRSRPT